MCSLDVDLHLFSPTIEPGTIKAFIWADFYPAECIGGIAFSPGTLDNVQCSGLQIAANHSLGTINNWAIYILHCFVLVMVMAVWLLYMLVVGD